MPRASNRDADNDLVNNALEGVARDLGEEPVTPVTKKPANKTSPAASASSAISLLDSTPLPDGGNLYVHVLNLGTNTRYLVVVAQTPDGVSTSMTIAPGVSDHMLRARGIRV